MSEMAQTATRLVVIGRGRLIADTTVDEFVARASHHSVTVRTPEAARLRDLLLARPDITVTVDATPTCCSVDGLTAEQIGTIAWHAHIPLYELAVSAGLTGRSVHDTHPGLRRVPLHRGPTPTDDRGGGGMTTAVVAATTTAPAAGATRLRVTPTAGAAVGVDEVPVTAVHRLHVVVAVVLMIGLGAMFAAITASQPGGFDPGATAISTCLTGTFFAQLAIGVLGVLLISGEYSTGMIRSSLTVVPRRLPMLWAKLGVFAGAVFVTMLVASVTRVPHRPGAAERAGPGRLAVRPRCAALGRRCGAVPDRRRDHRGRAGRVAAQHRRRGHHLRRGLLRDPAADACCCPRRGPTTSCSTCRPTPAVC